MLWLWGQFRIRCQAVLPLQHQAEQACSVVGVLEEVLNPQCPRVFTLGVEGVCLSPVCIINMRVYISAAWLLLSSWLSALQGAERLARHKGALQPSLPCPASGVS